MKTLFSFIFLLFIINENISQDLKSYSPDLPGNNIITDAIEIDDFIYVLQIDIGSEYNSNLIILDKVNGEVLDYQAISNLSFLAARFISIRKDSVFLLGRLKTDTCLSIVVSACYTLTNHQLEIISEIPFCTSTVQNLRIQHALDNEWLINGYWVKFPGDRRFILKMDNAYKLSLIQDSLISKFATVDFSRTGYLIKDESFCKFFDKDFNFRKERYSITEGINSIHQTHLSYGDHQILESFSGNPNFENKGHYVRIIDSALHVIKQLYIQPGSEDFTGGFEPPFFGGIEFINASNFWVGGNNNLSSNLEKPTHYSITKVNGNLEIDCNQYIGFDKHYRIYGLQTTSDGGVLVFGMAFNGTQDPYLIKLGPNCELPTVSTENPSQPIISISAYPNPATNSITFSLQGFDPSTLEVEFTDIFGRSLLKVRDLSTSIDVPDFAVGQYFYRIMQENKVLGVGSWVKE